MTSEIKFIWCLGALITWNYMMEKRFRAKQAFTLEIIGWFAVFSFVAWPFIIGAAIGDIYFDTKK